MVVPDSFFTRTLFEGVATLPRNRLQSISLVYESGAELILAGEALEQWVASYEQMSLILRQLLSRPQEPAGNVVDSEFFQDE